MNDETQIIGEIEKICGTKFRILNMPMHAKPENYYTFDNERSILTLGFDFAILNLDDHKLKLVGEQIRKLKKIQKFVAKFPKDAGFPRWFGDLKNIKTLIIKHSGLTVLPEVLKDFKNLERINLEDNELEVLPEWFKKFSNLSHLNVADNNIARVPNWLLSLPLLKALDFDSKRPVLALDDENITVIKQLLVKKVEITSWEVDLFVKYNVPRTQVEAVMDIKRVNPRNSVKVDGMNTPDEPYVYAFDRYIHVRVCDGTIRQLGLIVCSLAELPESIARIYNLNYLSLRDNKLKSLPNTIGNLKELKEIDLSNNLFSKLPDSFVNLTGIRKLNLDNNQFTEIPVELWNLKELTALNLTNNPLTNEEAIIAQKVPDLIREHLRKKATIKVFISHAVLDFTPYRVGDIVKYLEKQKEISQVFFCEENLAGNIDQWMLDAVQKCQLVLFIATKKSVYNSPDCDNELQLANKFSIPVIPIKGMDIDWSDLATKQLSRELGTEFDNKDFDAFCANLYKYIENFKHEINVMDKEDRKTGIVDVYERFRLMLDDRLKEIHKKIDDLTTKTSQSITDLEAKIEDIKKRTQIPSPNF
ncbi:MAG: small GTP-binding protein [Promethearchaeota archaeon CR_4]|nr:MAG: small GTP-binding protein [Candidatus Lokiarchaeota archaeon CR_4]